MSLAPGSRIGPYEITGSIGAGGMGEVFRGRDLKLGRDVAIKVLPANMSRDADRLARFEREARTLASLNHPNIAQVYGFEDGALVMELLEGETLRDRLRNGALPTRKAIEYATQIARGLAAAHDRGIIHRDLKPENVFLLRDGQVKLLDFGLARPMETATSGATETMAAVAGTDPGTVMGTVGYMSPEQVRAEPVDARTDLFSLGAVLYEMLTGERAFRRNTTAETMTAILREDPADLSSSRADISPAIDRIVRHAIEKNPLERFQTARDVVFALDSLSGSTSTPFAAAPPRSPITRERIAWLAVSAGLAAVALWLGLSGRQPAVDESSYQLNLALPDEIRTADGIFPVFRLGLTADGSTLAYSGVDPAGQRRMWIISLRTGAVRALDEAGSAPAFSPDGSQLVYGVRQAEGAITKRVSLAGGTPETIASIGGLKSWSPSGMLLFSTLGTDAKLMDMSAAATGTKTISKIYGMTSVLPDGRFLAGTFKAGAEPDAVVVLSADASESTRLIDGASAAWYAKGSLAFVKNSTLFAQRFDLRRMTLSGQPVTITEGVDGSNTGGQAVTGSPSGTLVVQRPVERGRSELKWFRRDGSIVAKVGDSSDYNNTELSPDGRRLLVSITDPKTNTRDLYIFDLQRGVKQRLTFDPSDERSGVWSADGQRIFYRSKNFDLYSRRADFTGTEEPLLITGFSKDPYSVSPDGKLLVYRASGSGLSNDVMLLPLDGKGPPIPLQSTKFDENGGSFSPDGKSIVYHSDLSGQMEVYVMAVGTEGGRVQLSTNGGSLARWLRNGKEIVYLSADRELMSIPVSGSGPTFVAGTPKALFRLDTPSGGGVPYDVTADGQQIIAITSVEVTTRPRLTAIINWPALVPK